MAYITTHHRFVIDDNHPSDVFGELTNFFSLYSATVDNLRHLSLQLTVPPDFDVDDNKKLAAAYRQFIQGVRYTVPDAHILPLAFDTQDQTTDNANTLTLLIQHIAEYDADADAEFNTPSLYQRTLGKLLPKFHGERSDDGLYPAQSTPTLPQATQALPPVAPMVNIPRQPMQAPQYAAPAPVNPPASQNTYATPPQDQHHQPQRQAYVQPQPPQPTPSTSQPPLPNIAHSAKPHYTYLTDVIVREAERKRAQLVGQTVRSITLKPADGLTLAWVEQLFASFNAAASQAKGQAASDAIGLVSYGYEILKPKLQVMGVSVAEDMTFGLKTTAKAGVAEHSTLQSGTVLPSQLNLGVKFVV
ncbi:hypothetical protein [Moraxella atlantae]|uniref:Uncharacterized protein n=1 Tax=Faucicola atlantae TaxID=34059 RepID=A0A378Q3G3_9GAMM|nr:hypothetical protein [Moraxella atlantae]OPH34730.1 hypothetical protein B5J92_06600 [Moraxella atlantae]STY95341.1 Uncharacterised protein [Moraxella atlantae]